MSFELDTFTQTQPRALRGRRRLGEAQAAAGTACTSGRSARRSRSRSSSTCCSIPKRSRDGLFPELVLFDCHACHHPMSDMRWSPRTRTEPRAHPPQRFEPADAAADRAPRARPPRRRTRSRSTMTELHQAVAGDGGDAIEAARALQRDMLDADRGDSRRAASTDADLRAMLARPRRRWPRRPVPRLRGRGAGDNGDRQRARTSSASAASCRMRARVNAALDAAAATVTRRREVPARARSATALAELRTTVGDDRTERRSMTASTRSRSSAPGPAAFRRRRTRPSSASRTCCSRPRSTLSNTIYKYQKGKHVMAEPQILPLRSPLVVRGRHARGGPRRLGRASSRKHKVNVRHGARGHRDHRRRRRLRR